MKKNRNNCISQNDIQMKFPKICETEILPQDELKIDSINHTLSGKQFQKIIQNYFSKLLTNSPTKIYTN